MIDVQGLTKNYGSVVAVHDVSFCASKGAVVGLLGPNGAGKTTTLRMLAGVLGPTFGKIVIAGDDILESPLKARANIGYLAEAAPLYPEMRVIDYLLYRAALKSIRRRMRSDAVRSAAAAAHCGDVLDVDVSRLSRGYRQRVGLADALLATPPVLLLDEPTAGLDPNQIREVRELIGQLAPSHTIILSTHVLAEVEAICTEAVVIHKGQLVAHDTLDALRARRQYTDVILLVSDPNRRTPAICAELGWTVRKVSTGSDSPQESSESDSSQYSVSPKDATTATGAQLESLVATLVQNGVGLREVRRTQATLEEVFSALTDPEEAP